MEGLIAAWLVGEGLVTWRTWKHGAPPTPGQLAAVSGFFALLALLALHRPARGVATALAVGIDIAALLQVLPGTQASVHLTRTWPPAKITDPAVFLPGTPAAAAGTPGANPATQPGTGNPANPPGTVNPNPGIPPTGPGTIFPPGSQGL
jgi:hypothetical protein